MAHSSDGQRRLHTGEEIAASGGEQGQVGTNLFRLLPHEPSPGATGEAGILSPGAALGGKIHRLQSNLKRKGPVLSPVVICLRSGGASKQAWRPTGQKGEA